MTAPESQQPGASDLGNVESLISNILEFSTEYSIIGEDLDGNIILWNEGARRIYGYEPEEVVGKANSALLHIPEEVQADKPKRILEYALRDGKWEGIVGRIRKNGERFLARVVITLRRDASGQPIGFLLISKDISDEIGFTEELQAKNAELERANQAKDRFLANMSHELRTPLNVILGFTSTLLMKLPGPLNADQHRQLTIIKSSAKHLLSLINDLLDVARIESGKVELKREAVAWDNVVEEVVTAMRPLAESKGLTFEAQLPGEEFNVRTDRLALSQILLNLTNNAIKFTERGSIRLEVVRSQQDGIGQIEFRVIDSGVGIRQEDQKRLFQPFSQINDGNRREMEGAGLGLHLSQMLASLLGGHIHCKSEFGKGSAFTLVLKATIEDAGHPG